LTLFLVPVVYVLLDVVHERLSQPSRAGLETAAEAQ